MRILVISLAGIGDTLFATPLIHELRASYPQAVIDALVMWAGARDVLTGNPHLNTVYQKNLLKAPASEWLPFLWRLRKPRYDISINTHPQSRVQYRAVAKLVNASVRVSHQYDNRSLLDHLLVNRLLPQDYAQHAIENNLALLKLLGTKPALPHLSYELYLSGEELAWADAFIATQKLKGRKLLGMHVGSGGTKNLALRRWPLDSYVRLIKQVNKIHPEVSVLLFGGPEEEKDHAQILASSIPGSVLCPATKNIRQAAALLKQCHLFLSVDTALMHMAAAMKVPRQFVIETPTWNKVIEPYGNSFILVPNPAIAGRHLEYYRYDGKGIKGSPEELIRCMASVSVETVYAALRPALELSPAP